MKKKYVTTFKWFNGKRYGVLKGSNLHVAMEFGVAGLPFLAITVWAVFFIML